MVTKIKFPTSVFFLLFSLIPTLAMANPENDRMYALESLSWLKPIDNVDGIFNDFIDETYEKYFSEQTRFQIKKLGNTNAVLSKSKTPYYKLAKDLDVIKKISRQFRVESILRTNISKEASSYRILIEWVYAPRGDVLAQYEFRYYDPGNERGLKGSDLPNAIHKALDEVITHLPFLGQLTGVEGDTVTVNMGKNQGIAPKEILTIYTLQTLKRHPLEQKIEEWRWAPIGKVQLGQVEESISFAKIIEVEPGQTFDRYQKVREILPAPPEPVKKETSKKDEFEKIPRIGWVAGSLGLGLYSRDVGQAVEANARSGGGIFEMGQIDGQLWFNSRWIAQASIGAYLLKYNAKDLAGTDLNHSYPGSAMQIRMAAGYALFPAKTIFDPIGWVHAGYKNTSYSLTASATDSVGSSGFGSFFLGLGGELPISTGYAVQMGFDIGLIRSFSETDLSFGETTGGTADLAFNIGGTYRYTERLFLRLMINLNSQSANFNSQQSISQKLFSITPSVMYYF